MGTPSYPPHGLSYFEDAPWCPSGVNAEDVDCAIGGPIGSGRFAARPSGLASGLALAVRPAGLAEVSGAQGWVLKIVSAKRF
jgi:hypothetical protein